MKSPLFLCLALLSPSLFAATVSMTFSTTVDTSAIDGNASSQLIVSYTFDSALADADGSPTFGQYRPIQGTVQLGGTIATILSGGIMVSNQADRDTYSLDMVFDGNQRLLDCTIASPLFLRIDDWSALMFSSDQLPLSADFAALGQTQSIEVTLNKSLGGPKPPPPTRISVGIYEDEDTPVGDRTPFTLTSVPEPGTGLCLGFAALAALTLRQRR